MLCKWFHLLYRLHNMWCSSGFHSRPASLSYTYKCMISLSVQSMGQQNYLRTIRGYSFPALQNKISKDLKGIASWLFANRRTLNGRVLETDFMAIGSRQRLQRPWKRTLLFLCETPNWRKLTLLNSLIQISMNI